MRCMLTTFVTTVFWGIAAHSALADDDLDRPFMGLRVAELADAREAIRDILKLALPTKEGVVVIKVASYSPAQNAGIRPLDVITSIDGKRIRSVDEFDNFAKTFKVGAKYKLAGYTQPAKNAATRKWRHGTVEIRPVKMRDVIFAAMTEQVDKVKDRSFFEHRDTPGFGAESDVKLYFSTKDEKPEGLRVRIQYVATDWLFIGKFTFKADDKTFTIEPPPFNGVERDHNGGKIWEWYDIPVTAKERTMLEAIATSRETILRCEGRQYQKDRTISPEERDRLRTVLLAFKAIGGE
jgi:membrane-associated protease RseP (regulator of RpoE activity)